MTSKSPHARTGAEGIGGVGVTVTVSQEIYAALDRRAARRGQSVAKYLTDFLDEYGRDEWIDDSETPQERQIREKSIRALDRAVRKYDRPVRVRSYPRRRRK